MHYLASFLPFFVARIVAGHLLVSLIFTHWIWAFCQPACLFFTQLISYISVVSYTLYLYFFGVSIVTTCIFAFRGESILSVCLLLFSYSCLMFFLACFLALPVPGTHAICLLLFWFPTGTPSCHLLACFPTFKHCVSLHAYLELSLYVVCWFTFLLCCYLALSPSACLLSSLLSCNRSVALLAWFLTFLDANNLGLCLVH